MAEEDLVLMFDKPHFVVKLYKDLLEVDLKEGARKEFEDVLEAKPFLRESLGFLFQTVVPLDVPLRDIESATVDKEWYTKISVLHRRDIVIPLLPEESQQLIDKLNKLVPLAKKKVRDSKK
jgi:hypothetical protein